MNILFLYFLLTSFNNHTHTHTHTTMIPIKNIVLVKINKRYVNKKIFFMKKNQNNYIFKFNNNAK
jgi:hypothetical protein